MKKEKTITDEQLRIAKLIMKGKAYVKIDRVSASGMTRYMRVYLHNKNGMQNITRDIEEVLWRGMDKQGNIKVWWCGMDMCFHMLYSYLWHIDYNKYARKWDQRYNTL